MIVIVLLILGIILVGLIGVFLVVKGAKAAKETETTSFLSISRLDGVFDRLGRLRKARSVMYVGVSLKQAQSIYSGDEARKITNEIISIFLKNFSDGVNNNMSYYEKDNLVILNDVTPDSAKKLVEKTLNDIDQCLASHNALNMADVNFGICNASATQLTFDEAINRAKQAYILAVKESEPYVEWNGAEGRELVREIEIENKIENDINNNNFFLEYQPVIAADTKKIVGAEVLSRLNSQLDGVLAPKKFLNAVRSVGLNGKFDYYVFEKNCIWISNNKEQRERYLYTINFSRKTLSDVNFVKKITDILEKYNLKYSTLAVEILEDTDTEGEDKEQLIKNLAVLRELGVSSILLDDFGSGYTTFNDLQNLAVDTIKLDKSLIKNAYNDIGKAVFNNIVRMAKDIGLKTVCEGVETEEQAEIAVAAGCDMIQGFYYYYPMPAEKIEKVLETNAKAV